MDRVSLIFVNPIEYHGPHLPLSTDTDISRGLWKRFEAALERQRTPVQVIRVREIQKGCDPARGPGSEWTSLSELRKILLEASEQILEEDPDVVIFMTFHGAPKHAAAIETAIEFLRSKGVHAYNPFNWVLRRHRDFEPDWVASVTPLIEDADFRPHWVRTVPQDFHGGLFETSVLLALDPAKVSPDYRQVRDCPERDSAPLFKFMVSILRLLRFRTAAQELAIGADATAWAEHPTYLGYTGKPRLATAAIGEAFVDIILRDYLRGFEAILDGREESPRPILQWTIHLT